MERCKKFVFEEGEERTFNVYSELPIVLAGEYAEVLSIYVDKDGNKAVIPPGWTVSGRTKENIIWGKELGLVIYHIPKEKVNDINWKNQEEVEILMRTYDQFIWTPVGLLTANGTLDGIHFDKKFGRMNYRKDKFSKNYYYEPIVGEIFCQKESVDKYDGYYSSRYAISGDKETGKPRSIKNVYPWINIDFSTAKKVASTMVKNEIMSSHLMYGTEYDTREKWSIETKTVTIKEIAKNSTELGNYCNNKKYERKMVKTGEDGCINNIYGFAGNISEWTQEQFENVSCVIRGGNFSNDGDFCPACYRSYCSPSFQCNLIGFRVVLCIK